MIYTIGHSTRTLDEFVALLEAHQLQLIVDVRTLPRSRRVPQFNRDALAEALAARRIGYVHLGALGGLRRPRPDSVNTGWRNTAFRGYADYMQTAEFRDGLKRLVELGPRPLAVMCAEAVPWRCHRSLLADALVFGGVPVSHILDAGPARPHTPTPFARRVDDQVVYPAA
jgi:uncharacterized protein (DUF488 family)